MNGYLTWTGIGAVLLAAAGGHRPTEEVTCPPGADAGAAPLDVTVDALSGTFRSAWAIAKRGEGDSARSILLHWDGCGWREESSPVTDGRLHYMGALWSDGDDVWVSGGELFRRRNGGWRMVQSPKYSWVAEMRGSGPHDLWMLEGLFGRRLLHWNGAKVEVERIDDITDIKALWGNGPNDLWVASGNLWGAGGNVVARRRGKGWQRWKLDSTSISHGAGGGTDVWVSNRYGGFQHWDGRSWSGVEGFGREGVVKLGTTGEGIYVVTASGELRIRNGGAWTVAGALLRPQTHPSAIPPWKETWHTYEVGTELWVDAGDHTGGSQLVRRHDGQWIPVGHPGPAAPRAEDVVALWADGRATVWAAVSFRAALAPAPAGEIRRLDRKQSTWTRAATLDQFPTAIHGLAPDDVWAVGFGGHTWHWDGESWRSIATGGSENLFAVWGAKTDDVWAAGAGGELFEWDGKSWRRWVGFPIPAYEYGTRALVGTGPHDVWAAGTSYVLHWDGRGWATNWDGSGDVVYSEGHRSTFVKPAVKLLSLFAVGPSDVWAVGTGDEKETVHPKGHVAVAPLPRTLILHWNGREWSWLPPPNASTKVLRAVSGTSAKNVWAVGDAGTVLHWNGEQLTAVRSPTTENLTAVAIDADGRVWVGGTNATLRRLD